jgi:hypothetical protein
VPDIVVLILWMLGWFVAGLVAGRVTRDENVGIIAGVCGGLMGVVVALAAPLIIILHRGGAYPGVSGSSAINILASEILIALPELLLLLGLSVIVGFVGSWLAIRIFGRHLARATPVFHDAETAMYRRCGVGIFVVLLCVALALTYLAMLFPISHLLQEGSYDNYGTDAFARTGLLSLAVGGAVFLCIYSFVTCLFVSRFDRSRVQRKGFLALFLLLGILGSLVNVYMMIVYVYSDVPFYRAIPYALTVDMVKSYIQPYLASIPRVCVVLFLGIVGVVLLGAWGTSVGGRWRERGQGAVPKEERLTVGTVMEPREE